MKRAMNVTTLLAMGFLMAAPLVTVQATAETTSGGKVTVGVLGRDDIESSKFFEYREVPKGVTVPFFSLYAKSDEVDFSLFGYNVSQDDQRYLGWFDTKAFDLSFDYNQILHNMGFDGKVTQFELSEGVWGMSDTLQQSLGTTVNATPTTGRNVTFYDQLLAPTFAAAGSVDVTSIRKRGTATIDFSKKLPFDLAFTYMRELKSGYRGEDGGGIYSAVSSVVELPSPLNEVTQDIAFRAAYKFKKGDVHASFARNLYNNRAETYIIDNPFQWYDQPYVSTPAPAVGGGSRARWIAAPDNEASTFGAGFLLKFARQTRISGDVSMGKWTQDAPFYPYTINSAILTPSGARADSLSVLPQPSFDGKIDTTTINFTFSSRPVDNLSIRAAFRSYELENKTDRFVITGDVAASPDRSWSVVTPSADAPYGHATANVYDNKSQRFSASLSYDIGDLTLEGHARFATLERTSREATKGDDNGWALAAVYDASDWMSLRASYDQAERTVEEGETLFGFQSDEAARDTKRTGLQVDFTLPKNVDLSFAYFRRDVEYPDRPNRIAQSGGVPIAGAQPIPGTPSGLLEAKYDSFTAEIAYAPSEKFELGAYYTYEKDDTVNQWSTTTGVNLNNLLNYAGTDETDTFGFHAMFQKPETWKLSFYAMRQKVDGFMDITAREAGSFYTPGRTTLIPAGQGGAADINDWDDTELTTVKAQFDYTVAKDWTLSAGYWYEKYDFKDAYTAGSLLMPQSIVIVMKSNDGPYEANVVYAKLSYRF